MTALFEADIELTVNLHLNKRNENESNIAIDCLPLECLCVNKLFVAKSLNPLINGDENL